jgi:hypothetical protein
MKAKLFNIMLTYAAQGAIAKAQLYQAVDYHNRALLRTTIASLAVYFKYCRNIKAIQAKAQNYHFDYRLRHCLLTLRQFAIDQKEKRTSEAICQGFKD